MKQHETAIKLAEAEIDILRSFRRYGLRSNEMLFFNKSGATGHSRRFREAMRSMVERGLVIQEARHRDAYSLSLSGYHASLSV